MSIEKHDGILKPEIHDSVFIAKGACIYGDVEISEGSSVWFNAVIRGDEGKVVIGRNSNIQDNAVIHSDMMTGVEIGSNINGVPIGDEKFDPFFAAAADLGAAVFVHALHPTGVERLIGPANLQAGLLFPCEIALAAASVLTGGLLDRHPNLRLGFSHGGGALGLLLPRLARDYDVPLLALSFDEHSGEAGLVTRLEAFVDLLERRTRRRGPGPARRT